MNVRYRARALADLEDIFRYLDQRSPAGARNVLRAIHHAIQEIADQPSAAVRTSEADIRVKILGRYRYKVFYCVGVAGIEIVHIRHAARRPWIG